MNNKRFLSSILKKGVIESSNTISQREISQFSKYIVDSRIEGILLSMISRSKANKYPHHGLIRELKESYAKRHVKTTNHVGFGLRVINVLNKYEYKYAILKGFYLAEFAYKDLSLRPLNDIDILIESDKKDQVYKILSEELELKEITEHKKRFFLNHFNPLYSKSFQLRLEPHFKIFRESTKTINDLIFENIHVRDFRGNQVNVLSPELNLLHIIYHGSSSSNFDVGPQYLFDARQLIKNEPLDWGLFNFYMKEFNLVSEVSITLALMERLFEESYSDNDWFRIKNKDIVDQCENIIFGPFVKESVAELFYKRSFISNLFMKKQSPSLSEVFRIFFVRLGAVNFKLIRQFTFLLFNRTGRKILKSKIKINNFFSNAS